jgi:signal transduction histidine kinase
MTPRVDILLVDDHEENLLALEAILVDPSFNLVRAASGRAALKEVLRREFALILLDVAMPDLDGYETAELIRSRERSRQTPIIFLTANYRSDAQVFRGYSVGAVDYIFKPFSAEILRSKVAVFVELYQKREALKRQTQALLLAHEELEDRVRARTRELAETNTALRDEVDERKRIEAERLVLLESEQRARANAEAVNRLKDEFLATLSHELRTPLNAILGWSHLLNSRRGDPGMVERAIGVIRNNAMSQSQLIEDILDVSRIIGGKLRLKMGPVPLQEVLAAALDSVSPAAQAKAIEIVRNIDDLEPITGDYDRLQQVVWNLLSNAVKFTPREGRVTVTLTRKEDDVVLQVQDTGIGIAPHFLPHVFDRFSQADGSATRRHGGLGLGMAIVRHLIELHGGTVRVHSEGEGQGTTFTIELPTHLEATVEDDAPATPVAEAGDEPATIQHLDGVSVMVVDDDQDSRSFMCQLLQSHGASVVAVESTSEALGRLTQLRPCVLISDIGMPGEDGYALIRRVRELSDGDGGGVPAIALTAYARPEDQRAALVAGYQRHLSKPVAVSHLVATIAELAAGPPAADDATPAALSARQRR